MPGGACRTARPPGDAGTAPLPVTAQLSVFRAAARRVVGAFAGMADLALAVLDPLRAPLANAQAALGRDSVTTRLLASRGGLGHPEQTKGCRQHTEMAPRRVQAVERALARRSNCKPSIPSPGTRRTTSHISEAGQIRYVATEHPSRRIARWQRARGEPGSASGETVGMNDLLTSRRRVELIRQAEVRLRMATTLMLRAEALPSGAQERVVKARLRLEEAETRKALGPADGNDRGPDAGTEGGNASGRNADRR